MPLQSAASFEKVLLHLSVLRYIFVSKSKRGHFDLNKQAEPFFRDVLNMVFDWQLEHMNSIQTNYPAIDLGDTINKISVQVTAQNSSTKIQKTLDKFSEKGLHKKYDRLIILILTHKRAYKKKFAIAPGLSFDPANDIWDIDDLLAEIEKLKLKKLKSVADFVEAELRPLIQSLAEPGSVFSSAEARADTPPKNANAFLDGHLGFEGLSDEERAKEFKAVIRIYDKLRNLSRDARGFLAIIVSRGEVARGFYGGKISILASELTSITKGIRDGRGHFAALENAGLADSDVDGSVERLFLTGRLPESGCDFFAELKDFCGSEEKLRRVLEDCAFDLLDG